MHRVELRSHDSGEARSVDVQAGPRGRHRVHDPHTPPPGPIVTSELSAGAGRGRTTRAAEVLRRAADSGLEAVRAHVPAYEDDAEGRWQRRTGVRPVLGALSLELG